MSAPFREALRYPGLLDGIDLSQVQTIYDAKAVAAAGFAWATVKTSEGVSYCDPRALTLLEQLSDVGIICNVYTFLRPSQGRAREQVRKAYACAGDVFPGRVALDLEGAPDWMLSEDLLAFAEEAIDEALSQGALPPELYSYPDFYTRRCLPAFARSALVARCRWFGADYGPTGKLWVPPPGRAPWTPPPFATWTKWQYSGNDGFRVPGIAGACDRGLFNGDLAAYRAYMGLDGTGEPDAPVVRPAIEFPPRRVRVPGDDEPPPTAA